MSEDDWETADLSSAVNTKAKSNKLSLRAGAPTFQPRPPGSPTPAEAGPSRQSPSLGGYVSRVPVSQQPDEFSRGPPVAGGGAGDEWFRGPKPASNRQIWDAAAASQVVTPSPAMTLASPLPPQPGITILRRQPGGAEKKRGSGTATPPKTMEEREEEYRLARERIFGGGSGANAASAAGEVSRPTSNGGRSRTPLQSAGAGEGRTASPAGRLYDEALGPGLGPVPVQIRRSPAPGVLRQPMGPGEGFGFGR